MNDDGATIKPTCLFTGAELDDSTKIEHTIPRSLGGRIRSNRVSSNLFNEQCGNKIDCVMRDTYGHFLAQLGPLLPRECKPGNIPVEVAGEPPGLILDENGGLTRQNIAILTRDENEHPVSATAASAEAIKKILKQSRAYGDGFKVEIVPPAKSSIVNYNYPTIAVENELCALKSILLTFDHFRGDDGGFFTRSPQLQNVRAYVHNAVIRNEKSPIETNRFSLGRQYEKTELYRSIRDKIVCTIEKSDFEQVLLVSANRATRTLDAVWLAFSFDPHGFRLCHDWDGDDFAYIIVNGVLENTTCSALIKIAPQGTLCKPTTERSTLHSEETPTGNLINSFFQAAHGEAKLLVERKADRHVCEFLNETALLLGRPGLKVADVFYERLARMLVKRSEEEDLSGKIQAIIQKMLTGKNQEVNPNIPYEEFWGPLLPEYRECFESLIADYRLALDAFPLGGGVLIVDPAVALGKLPPI